MYAACLEHEGLQELEVAFVGTPESQIVDLMAARIQGPNVMTPLPSGVPLAWRDDGLPLLWSRPQREPSCPNHHYMSGPKGCKVT